MTCAEPRLNFLGRREAPRGRGRFLALFTIVVLSVTCRLDGSTTGSVRGRIFDPQGKVVPGAEVRLTNLQDGAVRTGRASDVGAYEFTFVDLGSYRLEASAPGFQTVSRTVVVSSGQALTADLRLPAVRGGVERIEVRAGPIAMDTRSAAVQSSFSQAEIVTLLRASRNLPVVLLEPI